MVISLNITCLSFEFSDVDPLQLSAIDLTLLGLRRIPGHDKCQEQNPIRVRELRLR